MSAFASVDDSAGPSNNVRRCARHQLQSRLDARQPPPSRPVQPRPRTKRPGFAPVGTPSLIASWPLTSTSDTPSRTGAASRTSRGPGWSSDRRPRRPRSSQLFSRPRSASDRLCAGSPLRRCTASSSVSARSLAHVARQQAREVAVGARMRVRQQEYALGRHRATASEPKLIQGSAVCATHVVLGHQRVGDPDPRAVLDHEVDRGVLRRHAPFLRDRRERPPGERLQLRVLEGEQQRAFGTGVQIQVLPVLGRVTHLGDHAGPDGRVAQARDPGLEAAVLHPGRHGRVQARGAAYVGVHVRGDAHAVAPRLVHHLDRPRRACPSWCGRRPSGGRSPPAPPRRARSRSSPPRPPTAGRLRCACE